MKFSWFSPSSTVTSSPSFPGGRILCMRSRSRVCRSDADTGVIAVSLAAELRAFLIALEKETVPAGGIEGTHGLHDPAPRQDRGKSINRYLWEVVACFVGFRGMNGMNRSCPANVQPTTLFRIRSASRPAMPIQHSSANAALENLHFFHSACRRLLPLHPRRLPFWHSY